eukprot:29855-Pelagococcus_subviridis.AAC.6
MAPFRERHEARRLRDLTRLVEEHRGEVKLLEHVAPGAGARAAHDVRLPKRALLREAPLRAGPVVEHSLQDVLQKLRTHGFRSPDANHAHPRHRAAVHREEAFHDGDGGVRLARAGRALHERQAVRQRRAQRVSLRLVQRLRDRVDRAGGEVFRELLRAVRDETARALVARERDVRGGYRPEGFVNFVVVAFAVVAVVPAAAVPADVEPRGEDLPEARIRERRFLRVFRVGRAVRVHLIHAPPAAADVLVPAADDLHAQPAVIEFRGDDFALVLDHLFTARVRVAVGHHGGGARGRLRRLRGPRRRRAQIRRGTAASHAGEPPGTAVRAAAAAEAAIRRFRPLLQPRDQHRVVLPHDPPPLLRPQRGVLARPAQENLPRFLPVDGRVKVQHRAPAAFHRVSRRAPYATQIARALLAKLHREEPVVRVHVPSRVRVQTGHHGTERVHELDGDGAGHAARQRRDHLRQQLQRHRRARLSHRLGDVHRVIDVRRAHQAQDQHVKRVRLEHRPRVVVERHGVVRVSSGEEELVRPGDVAVVLDRLPHLLGVVGPVRLGFLLLLRAVAVAAAAARAAAAAAAAAARALARRSREGRALARAESPRAVSFPGAASVHAESSSSSSSSSSSPAAGAGLRPLASDAPLLRRLRGRGLRHRSQCASQI